MSNSLHTQLLLEHRHVTANRAGKTHALIRLDAEGRPDLKRPPLDLVACIDVSGSMAGAKLDEVKRSLLALASELSAQDRLGITSFESEVAQVLPPTRMDAAGKSRLHEAVGRLGPLGSTFMSGGFLGAIADLKAAPALAPDAVRRVLLFTDGHANVGIPENDRVAWATLLRDRLEGFSVSWFGFGEDHDADFLSFLADLTRGNAYVAKDEDAITDAFAQELGGLLGVRAMDIVLELSLQRGSATLLNDERSEMNGERLVIRLDDLSCEERRDLVVELALPPMPAQQALEVRLVARWRDVLSGSQEESSCEVSLAFAPGPHGGANPEVIEAVALVFAANAQKRARAFAEQERWQDAVDTITEAVARLERLDSPRALALAGHLASFIEDYRDRSSYMGKRSKLKSAERAMSKQRGTGSEVDGFFTTNGKRQMQARFKEPPEPQVDPRLVQQLQDELASLFRASLGRARVSKPPRRRP